MTAWLGVVSRTHVLRAVRLGVAQFNHGKRAPVARLRHGDTVIYYSPRTDYPDGVQLRAFTAIGTVVDDEPWQADEGDFRPWRRRIDYRDATEAPIANLAGRLDLTQAANWGSALRRGHVVLTDHDAAVIEQEMCG
ncbi:EVE domain-containing protein [Humibacter ginsenosidimutans]|uniref:UPF0310 protein FPZ11_04285 n=1 Tax=Humibacter ginsenosidimutans TaxID=2599293 RepID=A0A5B8M2I0_9MICO|nr:EVE domain-containing protein [Humibacter ginsenosidimutans]QDZ14099.1 EVE domain-containing protein [Humibacter ginsenosidimutans]